MKASIKHGCYTTTLEIKRYQDGAIYGEVSICDTKVTTTTRLNDADLKKLQSTLNHCLGVDNGD